MTGVPVAGPEVPDAEHESLKYQRPTGPGEQPQTCLQAPRKRNSSKNPFCMKLGAEVPNSLTIVCCPLIKVKASQMIGRAQQISSARPTRWP